MKTKMMRGCGESLKVRSSDHCPDLEKHDYDVGIEPVKQKHTPTPWRLETDYHPDASSFVILAPDKQSGENVIATCIDEDGLQNAVEAEANAAFIVKAVNGMDAIIRLLDERLGTLPPEEYSREAVAQLVKDIQAIARAEEK